MGRGRRPVHRGDVIRLADQRWDQVKAPPRQIAPRNTFDLDEAFHQHGREIYLFCRNAIGDPGAAEECAQETFLRAWKAGERYDSDQASVRTWLFAIARNVIRDAFRKRARLPEPVDESRIRGLSAQATDPSQSLILVEALTSLSPEHREAIVAIHVVGLSYAELSATTEVPVATLRSRTHYGLRALRRHFDRREADDD